MTLLCLTEEVTYWAPVSVNSDSTVTYGAPVVVPARYARKDGIATDEKGNDQRVTWSIYTKVELKRRYYVALGDRSGDATPPDGARKVVNTWDNLSITDLFKCVA